ncbi:aspartate aminotransferase family protein [Clostridium sp. CM028]|uniref:aspartate aminotransferase family protein n=1 Tax=Clostridium sp. CM028 TaxID=2851575 RepID=UPI001C6EACCE|nr:aspartate aminotransferase family protein [Clostridium sp. CM028]MBW9149501.1 aspartate aminotransferase family protein [Clostridium sp. CM028]WLC62146.1 aspartate aminotransferase family protein [Clostridium sp. CM028]
MCNYIGPEKIIQKKKEFLFPCSQHFYKNPPQITRGEMQYLFDSEGKKYLDFFAGVSVVNCGHCNPEILDATIEQMKTLQHTSTIYLTQPIVDLAEKLSSVLPGDVNHSFFCCTGSEANEGALLLARLYTGRNEFISLNNSLHGRTYLTMSVTGIPMWRADPTLSDCVTFAPNTYAKEKSIEAAATESLESVEKLIEAKGPDKIAALIAEPVQGNGGIITPPQWYFKKLKTLLEKHGILLIIDEVQTGFARTGKMFAIEHYEIIPDIITVAKALGNGMPISAFCTNDKIAATFTKASASTLGGNPVAASTAIAVLDYISKNNLCINAENLGVKLKSGLLKLKEKYPIIYDVRGIGLMLGVELVKENGEPAFKETDFVLEILKDEGILLGKNGIGRNVLAFQPPLVITKNDVDFMIDKLNLALSKLC